MTPYEGGGEWTAETAWDRPFGYFVHHQGRGHAERCAALLRALPPSRRVTVFCARPEILDGLPPQAEVHPIPSLFEAAEMRRPERLEAAETPDTLHCAPLGWASVRKALAGILSWCDRADPALFMVDVSAELAQALRIASVPVVKVLQHGRRNDPGHVAAYRGASGLLAPYDARLEQPERPDWLRARTHHAGGIGVPRASRVGRAAARVRLGLPEGARIAVVVAGGGGAGLPLAPLSLAARCKGDWQWLVLGPIAHDWHATLPGNLRLLGWQPDVATYLAAADLVVTSAGNTLCHQVLAARRPWIVIPEWRYYDEQICKADALAALGVAHLAPSWPGSPGGWTQAIAAAEGCAAMPELVDPNAAAGAASWLEGLAADLWRLPQTGSTDGAAADDPPAAQALTAE